MPSRAERRRTPTPTLETGSVSLVGRGAEYDFLADTVELPTERYGRLALYDLDAARGQGEQQRPSVLEPAAQPPTGWPQSGLREASSSRGRAPLASREGSDPCNCKTVVSDSSRRRLAVLYASHRFTLPEGLDPSLHQLLELRVAYRDGLRAYLNGQLIASSNLGSGVDASPAARVSRGPEWEHFVVPLSERMLRSGENLLSFEVRPAAHAHGARFDAELLLRKTGDLARGPVVQQVRRDSALISFDTELPSAARVEYGPTKSMGQVARSTNGALARHHRAKLEGLRPGLAVHYRVVVDGSPHESHVFHVPPTAAEPLRFAVYGDMRGGHKVHATIVDSLLDEAIDFVIVTGDLVLRGTDEADWQRFFAVARRLLARLPYYPVAGNHDTGKAGTERRRMNEIFSLWPGPAERPSWGHWYSFDISGVHFVMLDSNSYRHEKQRAWLEEDLKSAAQGSRAIFAAVHAGPYSRGLHRGHRYAAEHYAPLLRKYGVTLLFSGHDHLYQRGTVDGLHYMVSGGGGAPLYSVRCGAKGKKRCKVDDGMQHVAKEHHYVLITVYPTYVSACPKRPDKSPLEPCIRYPLD